MDSNAKLVELRNVLASADDPSTWYRVWRLMADWPSDAWGGSSIVSLSTCLGNELFAAEPTVSDRVIAAEYIARHGAESGRPISLWATNSDETRLRRRQSLLAYAIQERANRGLAADLAAALLFFNGDVGHAHAEVLGGLEVALAERTEASYAAQLARVGRERSSFDWDDYDGMANPPGDDYYLRQYGRREGIDWRAFCAASTLWAAGTTTEAMKAGVPFATVLQAITWPGAQTLRLTSPDVSHLPPGLGELVELRSLYMHISSLEHLPSDLCALPRLSELTLENMFRLETLPDCFSDLRSLRTLKLSSCGFPGVPEAIFGLEDLETLHVNTSIHGREQVPPSGIGQLRGLRELEITNKAMRTLPDEIGQLHNLRSLTVHGFDFRTLPDAVGDLENLEDLSIVGSQCLGDLPAEGLGRLQRLRNFGAMWWSRPYPPPGLAQIPTLESVHLVCNVDTDDAAMDELRAALPNTHVLVSYSATVRRQGR